MQPFGDWLCGVGPLGDLVVGLMGGGGGISPVAPAPVMPPEAPSPAPAAFLELGFPGAPVFRFVFPITPAPPIIVGGPGGGIGLAPATLVF